MKTHVKKEMKKYPYKKNLPLVKTNIFSQIKERERRIREKLPNYAIIDENDKVIEKYRLRLTAEAEMNKMQHNYHYKLRLVRLDVNGNPETKYTL